MRDLTVMAVLTALALLAVAALQMQKTPGDASEGDAEMKQAGADERQSQQAPAEARTETQQAMTTEEAIAEAARRQAELEASRRKTEKKLQAEQAEMHDEKVEALRLCAVLFVVVSVLIAVVAVLMRKLQSLKSHGLAEPLLEPAKVEPKLFEGIWERDDGHFVSIKGSTVVHADGTEEQLAKQGADIESPLLAHRMVGFQDSPVVKVSSGKVEADRIKWDDGRVWIKTDQMPESILGS